MRSPLRALLSCLFLLPPRVCASAEAGAVPDDPAAAAQGVSKDVRGSLGGVVGDLNSGQVSAIYGERQAGDPGAVSAVAPRGTRASGNLPNLTANLPEIQLPQSFHRDAAAPPPVGAAQGGGFDWSGAAPLDPTAKPVPNPVFQNPIPCKDGQAGCVDVMMIKADTAQGMQWVKAEDFVEYGTLTYGGRTDTQIYDKRPWWKFWADSKQVSSDDIRQGQLGDCFLLASLAAISVKDPDVLRKMIKEQQSTLTAWVQLFDGSPPKPVMVGPLDQQFPVYKQGTALNGQDVAGVGAFSRPAGKQGALWPLMIEKAYTIKFGEGSYADINHGGNPGVAMTRITGRPSRTIVLIPHEDRVPFQELVAWDSNSQPIVMGTKHKPEGGCSSPAAAPTPSPAPPAPAPAPAPSGQTAPGTVELPALPVVPAEPPPAPPHETTDDYCTDPLFMGPGACLPGSTDPVCAHPEKIVQLEEGHAYWLKAVDAGAQTITLANPWGASQPTVTLPWARLEKSLDYVSVNDKKN